MLNSIISAILSVYLFFAGVFGIYPSDPTLIEGINEDPVPYLFDKTIEGFRYLHEGRELPFRLKAPEETEEPVEDVDGEEEGEPERSDDEVRDEINGQQRIFD